MTTIQSRFPPVILAQVQHEVQDLKEDFLSFIYDINKNEKPVWTILKEMKDTIPLFIDSHILKVLAQKYDQTRIKELKKKMPKKSLMNCRQQLNSLINAIEQENLLPEYIKALVKIVNNTNSSGQEMVYQRHSKNWRIAIKNKLLALMLLVYQFSLEKQKNIFNIVDLWYKIYPETPIWQLKDERYTNSNANSSNSNEGNSDESHKNQLETTPSNRFNAKESSKSYKSSCKKGSNKDDLISYELELLEMEFNRNLRISNPKEEGEEKGERENDMQADLFENDSSSNGLNQNYEDEQSTTQEEEFQDDSMSNNYNQESQIKGQQSGRRKPRRVQANLVKQTRKNRNETLSTSHQIADLTHQFERIHIESDPKALENLIENQPIPNESDSPFQPHSMSTTHNFHHSFSLENNNVNTVNNQFAHFQSQTLIPLNDSTNILTLKNNLSQLNINAANSPLAHTHQSPQQTSFYQAASYSQQQQRNENSHPLPYLDTQIQAQHQLYTPQKPSQFAVQSNYQIPTLPILRNPLHQVFERPLKDSTNSINFFISSQ